MKKKIKFELPVNSDDLFEIEIIHTVAEWEKVEAELEALRAKLEKAEKIIDIVHGMQLWQQLDSELFYAVKEYRGETK